MTQEKEPQSKRASSPFCDFRLLGAGVTPAEGSVKPTAGFTLNEVIYPSHSSTLRPFFPHLFVAVAFVQQRPFVRAFHHAAFDRIDLAPHDRIDFVALLVELRNDFARLPQRQREV